MTRAGDQARLIEGYEALQAQVAGMLELARSADWEALIERQQDYLKQAERIKQLDEACRLDEQGMSRKAELLETILTDDLAIRHYLLARREELGQLIGSSRRQRDLHRAYGKQAARVVDATDQFGKRAR